MSEALSAYPPPPDDVPPNLARPRLPYRLLVALLLLLLIAFLAGYLSLVAGALYLAYFAVAYPVESSGSGVSSPLAAAVVLALRLSLFGLAAAFAVYLVKSLFRREVVELPEHVELTEQQQPELFEFIRRLCAEFRSPFPARVYVNHEVNAAVLQSVSLINLVVPPRKHLLIGLGLLNDLDVVEFKAVLAHEFAHFSQRSLRISGHTMDAYRIMENMVVVRDRWDEWMLRACDLPWFSMIAAPLYLLTEQLRALLTLFFRLLDRVHAALRRQMEFNADLVAVSATGSDAPVHVLLKTDFAQSAQQHALNDLIVAAEHGLFTEDLFFHQDRAADFLRSSAGDPELGRPPVVSADVSKPLWVFPYDDEGTAAAWSTHPSSYDRERNAKRYYVHSPIGGGPAWSLIRDQQQIRRQVTGAFYESTETVRDRVLPATEVQKFIDEERAALTIDAMFEGIYDNRLLELTEFGTFMGLGTQQESPANVEQLLDSRRQLYAEQLPSWVARSKDRRDEALDEERRFFEEFDGSVFSLHYRLAEHAGCAGELLERYRFQLALQCVEMPLWEWRSEVEAMLLFLTARKRVWANEADAMIAALRQAGEDVQQAVIRARDLRLPALVHEEPGAPLISAFPDTPDLPELTTTTFSVPWLATFHGYLQGLTERIARIHVKSINGILSFQEQIAAECLQSCAGRRS